MSTKNAEPIKIHKGIKSNKLRMSFFSLVKLLIKKFLEINQKLPIIKVSIIKSIVDRLMDVNKKT